MRYPTITAAIGAAALGTAVLAGCSGTTDTPAAGPGTAASPATQTDHNAADLAFAQDMIPHHRQAVAMAELAPGRTSDARVLDLANRIRQAQDPEIQQMTSWLQRWGAQVPAGPMGGMGHTSMPGMMSAHQMDQLGQANGSAFDRLFLQMMIEHHTGAVEMARTELARGSSAEAKQLAGSIVQAQQAEIAEMQGILGSA